MGKVWMPAGGTGIVMDSGSVVLCDDCPCEDVIELDCCTSPTGVSTSLTLTLEVLIGPGSTDCVNFPEGTVIEIDLTYSVTECSDPNVSLNCGVSSGGCWSGSWTSPDCSMMIQAYFGCYGGPGFCLGLVLDSGAGAGDGCWTRSIPPFRARYGQLGSGQLTNGDIDCDTPPLTFSDTFTGPLQYRGADSGCDCCAGTANIGFNFDITE